MADDTERVIGRLEGQFNELKADVTEIKDDLKALIAKANESQGVFKALGWAGTALAAGVGVVGGVITKKLGLS